MRFLCLHGIGTSSELFKMQTAALRYELGDDHTYEFAQGSLEWPMAAELEAISKAELTHYAYFDPEYAPSYLKAYQQLDQFIATEGPFDGVFAFSQGAGLAVIYMARARVERPDAEPPFKCAILFSPTAVGDPFKWFETGEMRRLEQLPAGVTIETPTAVIWGDEDRYREEEAFETTLGLFYKESSWNYIFQGGHEVPHPGIEGSIRNTVKLARRAITEAHEKRAS